MTSKKKINQSNPSEVQNRSQFMWTLCVGILVGLAALYHSTRPQAHRFSASLEPAEVTRSSNSPD